MATPSEDLQKAIYAALLADPDVSGMVSDRIYDGVPESVLAPYISFASSDVSDDGATGCVDGIVETLAIDIWSRDQSRLRLCKRLSWYVRQVVHEAAFDLETHALADLRVTGFKVEADPDGITAHGMVVVRALIEVVD